MKKTLFKQCCVLLLLLSMLVVCGCGEGGVAYPGQQNTELYSRTVFAMDTVMDLKPAGANGEKACDLAETRIHELEAVFSVTDDGSDIYAVNHADGAAVTVSDDTLKLLSAALEFCRLTDGALDVSVYPVLREWGFTTESYQVPDDETLSALLENVDYTRVAVDEKNRTVTLPTGMEIDLGSVAKGYTGDQVIQVFRDAGVTSGIISLGGNVQVLGTKEDGSPWRIGVQDPNSDGYVGIVEVVDKAVVTSGGYERYFVEDGVTYWHILDPATGKPAHSGVLSATIIGDSGLMCDALSTALFVMGPDRAAQFWRENGGFEYLLVLEDGSLVISGGLTDCFSLTEEWADASVQVVQK